MQLYRTLCYFVEVYEVSEAYKNSFELRRLFISKVFFGEGRRESIDNFEDFLPEFYSTPCRPLGIQ